MNIAWIVVLSIALPIFTCALILVAAWFYQTRRGRIVLSDGIADLDEQELLRSESTLIETLEPSQRQAYERAKLFTTHNPPDSVSTDITLSQFLSIQEKGVSAWQFEPDLETANCFVEGRTEIDFYDAECCVQSNLPLPKQHEVYYWEAKIYDKSDTTNISIGLATKPYPPFRMPGWSKLSVAYFSNDGYKYQNHPFSGKAYGPQYYQGDVIGVGYRPRNGTIFFTRNGKKLEDVCSNWKWNLFPTVGADGPCTVHVNLGQSGFVFIEANVKKWGLAPMMGTLAPPPAYGLERGSILLLESNARAAAAAAAAAANSAAEAAAAGAATSEPQEPPEGPPTPGFDSSAVTDISLSAITASPPSYSVQDQFGEPTR